jgi:hypothetical protein
MRAVGASPWDQPPAPTPPPMPEPGSLLQQLNQFVPRRRPVLQLETMPNVKRYCRLSHCSASLRHRGVLTRPWMLRSRLLEQPAQPLRT